LLGGSISNPPQHALGDTGKVQLQCTHVPDNCFALGGAVHKPGS
jgi:hypothetical protein